jgi:hypothetical protein
MKSSILDEDSASMYGKAPIYLREAMLFPYSYGMEFARAILVKRGKQAAFAGVFEHPPLDTRQIMQPATYLSDEPQPQVKVVPLDKILGPEWRQEDVSGIGEIDLRVILHQWAGKDAAAQLVPAWRGGYYMALSRKKQPKDTPYPLALVLNFASPEAASRFAAIYESALPQRYKQLQPVPTPAACNTGSLRTYQERVPRLRTREWTTEEGPLCLYVDGVSVTAFESFVPADAARLHAALIPIGTTPLVAPESTTEARADAVQ